MPTEQDILSANILIVDDKEANVALLEKLLCGEGYTSVLGTTDPREVRDLHESFRPDLILLDINMPHLDGYQVMEQLKEAAPNDYLPILVLTAQQDHETRLRSLKSGAKDFLSKPFDRTETLTRIQNMLEVRLLHNRVRDQNILLEQKVRERTKELHDTRLEIIRRLGRAAEYRDNETGFHVIRMSHYSRLIVLAAGKGEAEAELVLNAAPMHDVGKIGIPDGILLKPGKLDDNEWMLMRKHCRFGAEIIGEHDSELLKAARRVALTHHEKWDGSGYPNGLRGEEIPLEGRITALADVFDALTSKRPYKEAWPVEKAVELIRSEGGKHFDPGLVPAFLAALPEILKIKSQFAEQAEDQHHTSLV